MLVVPLEHTDEFPALEIAGLGFMVTVRKVGAAAVHPIPAV
jgi:hypothetical protein